MRTKKDVLTKLYKDFHSDIKSILDVSAIFPDYELVDLVDIVYLVSYYFGPIDKYDVVIKDLLIVNQKIVDDETFNKAYPIIEKFINDFKNV